MTSELELPVGLHPDTAELVVHFAQALAEKLYAAQQKYGYSDNWRRANWEDECRAELMRHIAKGDPRDVAAYCAFLWYHGQSTATEQSSQPQVPEAYRKLEEWARKLPTPVCANGVLPLASELNELDEILTEIGR